MDPLANLNPAQREAVNTLSGPLLVLAGAGTGKTRVITHRMAALIGSGVDPERILSVTFTNKAAREMQERAQMLLGRRAKKRPLVCTFHSFCVRVLRREIAVLGYPERFAIYDRGDQESTARSALREIRVGDDALRPGDLLASISRWKMAGIGPESAADYAGDDREFLAATAYRKYQAKLRASGAVDFDDLLLLTNRLFEESPDVLQRHQRRFDHVQIDEYQDTNRAQFQLAEALVRPHRCLCAVGDDDQSIYGWRGADVTHILDFERHFPGAKVVRLEDNYRSTDRILEIANRLVRRNPNRHEKSLVSHKPSGCEVRFLEFEDDAAEAENVVGEVRGLIAEAGVPAGDVAILFRTNEQPRVFETALRRAGMRYVLIGGQSFYDRREIRDVLAYLKSIAFPDDEVSLLRIINTPARGIGQSSVEKLLAAAVAQRVSLWSVAANGFPGISPKTLAALEEFRGLLERNRRRFHDAPRKMDRALRAFLDEINYRSEIDKNYKEPAQQQARMAVLDQIIESLADYCARGKDSTLGGFLEELALIGRDEDADKEELLSEQSVRLMTLHSAKGLEFPHVYMVGMEEGLLPHRRSIDGDEASIPEERRLAYVGITRAMDSLTLTRAASRMKWGRPRPSLPSRFLFEMRDDAVAVAGEDEEAAAALPGAQA